MVCVVKSVFLYPTWSNFCKVLISRWSNALLSVACVCFAGGGAASAGDGLVGGAVAGAAAGAREIHGDRARDPLAHAGVQRPHDAPRGAAPRASLAAAAPASARARRPVLHVT